MVLKQDAGAYARALASQTQHKRQKIEEEEEKPVPKISQPQQQFNPAMQQQLSAQQNATLLSLTPQQIQHITYLQQLQ
jgi:hypothetical protein